MNISSDEHQRVIRLHNYQIFPWLSLPALVTAVILTVIYHPPLIGTMVAIAGSLLGGAGVAYGPLSRHRWLEKYGSVVLFLTTPLVAQFYKLDIDDGRFYTLLVWMVFGMLAPFWIWRKRGIEAYAPPVSSTSH